MSAAVKIFFGPSDENIRKITSCHNAVTAISRIALRAEAMAREMAT
jgi:hypothetical protein